METLKHKFGLATDDEIIEKVIAGETAFFEVLIRRYNALLYKIARSYGFPHHDAEDLMQESHFTAYLHLKTFRKEAAYKTWLTKIHLHKCYRKANATALKLESINNELIARQTTVMQSTADKPDAEKKLVNKELGRVLEKSLQQIPLPYRSVFVLREIEGFSVAETAKLLEITPINVKVRLNRAKTMLQEQLEKIYSAADLYEFHLMYCDKIVTHVFERIAACHTA